MATSNGLHRYISQMEEGLLELTQNLSVFLSHEFDLEEKYARDKRRLLEETHGLNLDTQKFLKRLSRRMLDEEQAIVHYFHLIKRWYCHLLLLIAYINYTPYSDRADKSNHLRVLGENILNSVSEMNEMDIIAPSERFEVLEGGSMKKKVAYHFQGAPEQQTPKGSAAFAQIHPPSNFQQRKPNNHPYPPTPNRWWNNPQGSNMGRHFQRWPYQ